MPTLSDFNYKIYGPSQGRKWVFLHGLMGFLNNWRTIITHLEATECCLTFDQRGHGRSFKPESGFDPEDYANDLKLILDELGWDQVVLVGHSMGGKNALNFGSRFPERLLKLVIEDISPASEVDGWKYYADLLGIVPVPFKSRTEAREFFQGEFKAKVKSRNSIDVISAYLYANMVDQPDGQVSWRFSPEAIISSAKMARATDHWDEVKALQTPTLWVRGADSKELNREDYEKILSMNRVISGVEVAGAGHWVHSEQALSFVTEIRHFVGGFP